MKKLIYTILVSMLVSACTNNADIKISTKETPKKILPKATYFNDYWYDGFAEITSYSLEQSRYGEVHKGTAVNIFVTEEFLPEKQVKADYNNERNIPVLKLNSTKKFVTGIYPYSLMTSTFTPVGSSQQTLKVSFSSQEWCGNTFMQLNNRDKFNIDFYSYFESNTDRKLQLEKETLENEIWTLIRINPNELPIGDLKMIPSFEYLALNHKELKAYNVNATLQKDDSNNVYTLHYKDLNRILKITFNNKAPFEINSWSESLTKNGNEYVTKAEKIKTLKSKYWSKNSPQDIILRDSLNL